jgi:predicted phosphoadenosine phosphosulfate sulfurtransferase
MAYGATVAMTKDDEYAVDVMETQVFSDTRLPDKQVREVWNYIKARMRDANLYEFKWGVLVETTAMRIAQSEGPKENP